MSFLTVNIPVSVTIDGAALGRIEGLLSQLIAQGIQIMSAQEDIAAAVAEVKQNMVDQADALAVVVAKLATLSEQLANGLTPDQTAGVVSELQSIRDSSQAVEDGLRAAGQ